METRKTLFLYPQIDKDSGKSSEIYDLIEELKITINVANEKIEKILCDSSFAYIRCFPIVNMEEVHNTNSQRDIKEAERVRICVIQYDDKDYKDEYVDICDKYKSSELDISHLVGIKICTSMDGIRFLSPSDSSFDLIVETGLINLEFLLIAIMLDISIYHYFSLSNELRYRKDFSLLKLNGMSELGLLKEFEGLEKLEGIKYLPFSYSSVTKMVAESNKNCKETVSNLIRQYFEFLTKHVCKEIKYTKDKELVDPYNVKKSADEKHVNYITNMIQSDEIKNNRNYFVVLENETAAKGKVKVKEHYPPIEDNQDAMRTWLSAFPEPLDNCSLYYVVIGG